MFSIIWGFSDIFVNKIGEICFVWVFILVGGIDKVYEDKRYVRIVIMDGVV